MNEYIMFCNKVRATTAWKRTHAHRPAPEQGRQLGAMWRARKSRNAEQVLSYRSSSLVNYFRNSATIYITQITYKYGNTETRQRLKDVLDGRCFRNSLLVEDCPHCQQLRNQLDGVQFTYELINPQSGKTVDLLHILNSVFEEKSGTHTFNVVMKLPPAELERVKKWLSANPKWSQILDPSTRTGRSKTRDVGEPRV